MKIIKDNAVEVEQSAVDFLGKANRYRPTLYERYCKPVSVIKLGMGKNDFEITEKIPYSTSNARSLGKGDRICLDFGEHMVGYLEFKLDVEDIPPDAPAHLYFKFGETIYDIADNAEKYDGDLSSSWIQEDRLHIDVIPQQIKLSRRYAFRYLEILVLDTSPRYRVILENIVCRAVTSANMSAPKQLNGIAEDLRLIDKVSQATLRDCMQHVFEDGPKRDRRLWIGDFRLQALTNYETFRNFNLVKRCLYLFAGVAEHNGWVDACLCIEPNVCTMDIQLFDYSMLFISCLHDYYIESNDEETLEELWPIAFRQALLAMECLDSDDVVIDRNDWWSFIDWNSKLNKQAGAQAILIYALNHALVLAKVIGNPVEINFIVQLLNRTKAGSLKRLWDEKSGFFISGSERQVSWASQILFSLAGVFPKEKNAELLKRLMKTDPDIEIVTPYLYHYLIDALIQCGEKDEALSRIRAYWGTMVELGADCFWEAFDPEKPYISPYNSRMINSYCHAWSCTPSYFIRKYFSNQTAIEKYADLGVDIDHAILC